MIRSDIGIAGAGIIGLSLALELYARGFSVVVADSGPPMRQASIAAAGMLAADDPHNPNELSALSHFSRALYPAFLERIHALSGVAVPFQTSRTLQALSHTSQPALTPELQAELLLEYGGTELDPASGFAILREHSVDPRQLAVALIAAVAATSIRTLYDSPIVSSSYSDDAVKLETPTTRIHADYFIDCTGAWASSRESDSNFTTLPIKGQMLALSMPADLQLKKVFRTEDFYIVPRTVGPHAGRAIVGATLEDVGFNTVVEPHAIEDLRKRAVSLVPGLARATIAESWAGLRPATADRLPLIGPHPTRPRHWLATGHFRNGILLAPATARVVADALLGQPVIVSLDNFSASRPSVLEVSKIV